MINRTGTRIRETPCYFIYPHGPLFRTLCVEPSKKSSNRPRNQKRTAIFASPSPAKRKLARSLARLSWARVDEYSSATSSIGHSSLSLDDLFEFFNIGRSGP